MTKDEKPFWEVKTLEEMDRQEWESLCDGCGLCCLIKLEDEETEERYYTRIACHLLDIGACKCSKYQERHKYVSDCIDFTIDALRTIDWLPPTCAYKLVDEGKPLHWWHPLVSGDDESVHQAGVSLRDWGVSEGKVKPEAFDKYISKHPFKG